MCPLKEISVTGNCVETKCMYHMTGQESNCAYKAVAAIRSDKLSRSERRQKVSQIFGMELDETEVAIQRVVSVLCLNEYFRYTFGKDVVEAKPRELTELKTDVIRYQTWRPSSKKVPFNHIITAIDFLFNELR